MSFDYHPSDINFSGKTRKETINDMFEILKDCELTEEERKLAESLPF